MVKHIVLCALYSKFDSPEDLSTYKDHPLHPEEKRHSFHLIETRVAADYIL